MSLAVQGSNITDITFPPTIFPSGARDIHLPTNKVEFDPVVVTFVVSEHYDEWLFLYKWIMRLKNKAHLEQFEYKSIEMIALNSQNQPGVKFIYRDAFPIALEGIQLAYNDDDSNVIVSTATFDYNRFHIVDNDGNLITEDYNGE